MQSIQVSPNYYILSVIGHSILPRGIYQKVTEIAAAGAVVQELIEVYSSSNRCSISKLVIVVVMVAEVVVVIIIVIWQ